MKLIASLMGIVVAMAMTTQAGTKNKTSKKGFPRPLVFEQNQPLFSSAENFDDSVKKLARSVASKNNFVCTGQSAAQVDISVGTIEKKINETQPQFAALRNELIGDEKGTSKGIKTKEQLDEFIRRYDGPKNSDANKAFMALEPSAKLLVLQLRALVPMKSFFFRAKGYVKKNSITRTTIVTMLRAQATGIQNFAQFNFGPTNPFQTNQNNNLWDAAFNYVTEPFENLDAVSYFQIDEDRELQTFLDLLYRNSVRLTNEYTEILKYYMANANSEKGTLWWDNKLFLSIANFSDPKDRYIKIGVAELLVGYSSLSMGMSALAATTSYSLTGFQDTIGHTSKLLGFDLVNLVDKNGADGIMSKNRFEILKKQSQLFELRSGAQPFMAAAYDYLVDGVRAAKEANRCIKERTESDQFLFDVRFAQSFNRVILQSLGNLSTLFEEGGVQSAVIQGEEIKINLKKFYTSPPLNLRQFYPQEFNDNSNDTVQGTPVTVWGQKDMLRNYKYGSSRAWNLEAYSLLFDDLTPMKENKEWTADIPKKARILSQSWGSAAFAIPLSALIF